MRRERLHENQRIIIEIKPVINLKKLRGILKAKKSTQQLKDEMRSGWEWLFFLRYSKCVKYPNIFMTHLLLVIVNKCSEIFHNYYSYALIEYFKDNPAFTSYFEEHSGIVSIFTLTEVYYSVLGEEGEEKANEILEMLYPLLVDVAKETIQSAMKFRFLHKKKKLSYADCVGYALAQERGISFLTGDQQFKDLPEVAFVR